MTRRRTVRIGLNVLVVAAMTAAATPFTYETGPALGVVNTFCDPQRVATERAAGIAIGVVSARWDLMEPTRSGAVDPGYVAQLTTVLHHCADNGLRVVLDPGLQFLPQWAKQLSGGTMRDQYGDIPVTQPLDVVHSAAARRAVQIYLRELVTSLPAYTVSSIRVGTTTSGELGLPGGADGGKGHYDSWWAFSSPAQTGIGLAAGQTPSPMPGWIPGQPVWNRRAVTPAMALTWWRWYERSVVQAEYFLARSVQLAGFGGTIHLPVAGRGVLPADLTAATTALLAAASMRDDAFARGLDYVDQMPMLAQSLPGVVIDLTSVDDATSVDARARTPRQDLCQYGDVTTSIDPATPVRTWSNLRFARAQVARAGLPAVGENPGPPGPLTGGVPNSDPEPEQVRWVPVYTRSCGLAALLFAFEDDLFTDRSGISLQQLVDAWNGSTPTTVGS